MIWSVLTVETRTDNRINMQTKDPNGPVEHKEDAYH